MNINNKDDIRPDYERNNREYYNRANAARYVSMTDNGFRRRIEKIEKEKGVIIPMMSLGGRQLFIDRRILDQFCKPMYRGEEDQWIDELKEIIETIKSEK